MPLRSGALGQGPVDDGGQFPDGPGPEDGGIVQIGPERCVDHGDHVECVQRGPAQVEEVVGDPDHLEPEQLGPDLADPCLDRGRGFDPLGTVTMEPSRRGQLRHVGLGAGGQWDLVDPDEGGGHRMLGEQGAEMGPELLRLEVGAVDGLVPGGEDTVGLRLVADVRQQAGDLDLVDLVVELLESLVTGLVSQPDVPAVGLGVVVVAPLLAVHLDAGHVDEAVRRPTGVGRSHPRRPRLEELVELGELDVDVAVEVEELDLVEDGVVVEDALLGEQFGHRVGRVVVDASGLEHRPVDFVGVEAALLELVRHQAGLEELPAGQPGHDDGNAHGLRSGDRDGVDGLVAALADIGVAIEAVAEDVVHDVGGGELVADAEVGHAAASVVLGSFGEEPRVEGQRVDVPAPFDQLVERVGRVLAAREQVEAVDVSPPAKQRVAAALLEVGFGPEPPLGLWCDQVEGMAHVADAVVVELGARDVDAETAPSATGKLSGDG